MKKIGKLSLILMIILFSCKQQEKIDIPPTIIVKNLPEKDMPYLELTESQLKSTNPEEDKQKAQILFSAIKRASKYIFLDTINYQIVYPIKSGDEINISPLLNEFIECKVYNNNKSIQNWFINQPELTEQLKGALKIRYAKEKPKNLKWADGSRLLEWSHFAEIIKKYREDIKK